MMEKREVSKGLTILGKGRVLHNLSGADLLSHDIVPECQITPRQMKTHATWLPNTEVARAIPVYFTLVQEFVANSIACQWIFTN